MDISCSDIFCKLRARGVPATVASILALVALPMLLVPGAGAAPALAQLGAPPVGMTVETSVPALEERQAQVALEIEDGVVPISLTDAVELALRRNLPLVVERYRRERAELTVFGNLGIYDLQLGGTASFSDSQQATSNTLTASQSESRSLTTRVSQLFPTGGTASANWTNSRSETNLPFAFLNPSYDSTLRLTFTQPLLRDLGELVTERQLLVSRLDSRIGLQTFEEQISTTVEEVEAAYWILVDSREQLVVAEEARALAEELHERNKIEVEVGTRAPLELVQSEATIATREEDIIRAEQTLGDAEDRLRRLLNLPVDLWTVPLRPTSEVTAEEVQIDVDEAVEIALRERPEVQSQRLNIERAEIDATFFANQKKPRLDLDAGYTLDGTAGDRDLLDDDGEPTGEFIDEGLSDALDQVLNRDFDGWSISLTFAFPIQNRTARANALTAELAVETEEVLLEDLRKQILTEVRTAVREVESAAQQISSARVSQRLQERNLEAEQKRYENGMSTSFQVTEIQEDLTQARRRLVSAQTAYRIALSGYYRTIGRLLEEFGIEIDDSAEDVRPDH